ncbi:translation initiation factor 2 [Streptomyces sp. NPDC002851]
MRSAAALHRLLDIAPVFADDDRVQRLFTLTPGSAFDVDALTALDARGCRTISWDEALRQPFDLILTASPKGELHLLDGPIVLLPHGAGFNKSIRGEGTDHTASGLDPDFLVRDGRPLAALHALAHPSQLARLAVTSPQAAARATVVGDPTLDRVLAARDRRDGYRQALGTGGRTLIALTSTWGPESLLRRRPYLPAELLAALPHDTHQLALVVHPNEYSRLGSFDLAERLSAALDHGLIVARPYEEWASVLIAADLVISDHGSTGLYAAALDRPLLSVHDGGDELLPDSPMAELLARVPRFHGPESIAAALDGHRPGELARLAQAAFVEQGQALELLRTEVYKHLGLAPPPYPARPRSLPAPAPPARSPAAFAVTAHVEGRQSIRIERFPVQDERAVHHLSAEHGVASERQTRGAGLLYRRLDPAHAAGLPAHQHVWTADGWTAHTLDSYATCRTAAAVLSPTHCVVRTRGHHGGGGGAEYGPSFTVTFDPVAEPDGGRLVYVDPAAVLSAVHAWLTARGAGPDGTERFTCLLGERSVPVRLSRTDTH